MSHIFRDTCKDGNLFSWRPSFPRVFTIKTEQYVSHHCEVAFHSDKYEWDTMTDLWFRIVLPKEPCNFSKHGKLRLKNGFFFFFSHTEEVEASHKSTLFKELHEQISSYSLPPPFWKRQIQSNLSQTFNIYFCHLKGENTLQQVRKKICMRN